MSGVGEAGVGAAHKLNQLIMDYFYNHLRRGKAFHNLFAYCLLSNGVCEIFCDFIVYIGLEQSHSDLSHSRANIGFVKTALASQIFESSFEPVGKTFKCQCGSPLSALKHSHCSSLYADAVIIYFFGKPVTEIILGYLIGIINNLVKALAHILKSLGNAEAGFHVKHLSLCALDGVSDALTGYAFVFRYFGEREVIIVIIFKKRTLFFSQHFAVKINQNGHFIVFCQDKPPLPENSLLL